jgi:DNA-binding CsgD family transcriptional regulator
METLEPEDIQKLNHSIQQIYTLHDLDTFGVDSLAIVDRLVSSDWPLFHLTDTQTGKISLTFLPNFSSVPIELLSVLEQVLSKDRANHPIAQHMPQTLNGAYKLSDFISQQELYCRERLYQQFLRPLDVEDQMLLFLPNVNPGKWVELAQAKTILAGFIINRHECSFTERDRSILNLLRPHLLQAYSNAQKYQQLQQNLSQVQQSLDYLGTIVLDTEGQIQSIAPQAIIWLETYFFKSTCCSPHLPDHLWAWVKHQIAGFTTKTDLPPTCVPLRIQQAGRELTIRLVVEASGRRYLLMLEEQTLSSLNSLAILGLTQRETEVLALIIQGSNNQAIAAQMNVTISTVRKHLENIYLKLGVKSRTEAIAQTLAKLGFLYSLPLR